MLIHTWRIETFAGGSSIFLPVKIHLSVYFLTFVGDGDSFDMAPPLYIVCPSTKQELPFYPSALFVILDLASDGRDVGNSRKEPCQ